MRQGGPARLVLNARPVSGPRPSSIGVANTRDVLGNLARGKLAAFAGLGALGHFDFEFFGVNEIVRSDAETTGGNLLDLVGGGGLEAAQTTVLSVVLIRSPARDSRSGRSSGMAPATAAS